MDIEIKSFFKCLYDIIKIHRQDILDDIKNISDQILNTNQFEKLADIFRIHIISWLKEGNMYTESFIYILNDCNHIKCFRYLVEIVQNEDDLKIKEIIDTLRNLNIKREKDLDKTLKEIPKKIEELKDLQNKYCANPEERFKLSRTLKEYANSLFEILILIDDIFDANNNDNDNNREFQSELRRWMTEILNHSFIITDYPSRIIRKATNCQTGTKFKANIECLIDTDKLHLREISIEPYMVDCFDDNISEPNPTECRIICQDTSLDSKNFELKNMIWKPNERNSRNRNKVDRITDNKSLVIFFVNCTAEYRMKTVKLDLQLKSDVSVVIVHSNQEIDAQITLFWNDNFDQQSMVMHEKIVEAISKKYHSSTKRGLSDSNKLYLINRMHYLTGYSSMSFMQFSRESMSNLELSFGQWIFNILKLIKLKGVLELWQYGSIVGFADKKYEPLDPLNTGSFILRFSEKSVKIGVVVKCNSGLNAWNPFSMDECKNRNLADHLNDYGELLSILRCDNKCVNKTQDLGQFHNPQTIDDGYTPRGQLLNSINNILYDPHDIFEDIMEDINIETDIDVD